MIYYVETTTNAKASMEAKGDGFIIAPAARTGSRDE